MANEGYDHWGEGLGPPPQPFLITPHDTNLLDFITRAISIGTAGNLKVKTMDGNDVVIPANALAIGIQHVMRVQMVYSTGTAADEIVGWY